MSVPSAATIPWRYQDSDIVKRWTWKTPHFSARIILEGVTFAWELGDLIAPNDGMPRFLAEGMSADFAAAEDGVREAIGKSYPPALGYQTYAGPLATTFTLATGERIDLGTFTGHRVMVTVLLPGGAQQTLKGYSEVVHYELHFTPDAGAAIRIQPPHIVRIVRESGTTGHRATYTGSGRIYRGTPKGDCTGRAGFLPDTIDHTGRRCPVHEDQIDVGARSAAATY